jgi:hypothetical protein
MAHHVYVYPSIYLSRRASKQSHPLVQTALVILPHPAIQPDSTYSIQLDQVEVASGVLGDEKV